MGSCLLRRKRMNLRNAIRRVLRRRRAQTISLINEPNHQNNTKRVTQQKRLNMAYTQIIHTTKANETELNKNKQSDEEFWNFCLTLLLLLAIINLIAIFIHWDPLFLVSKFANDSWLEEDIVALPNYLNYTKLLFRTGNSLVWKQP